MLCILFIVIKKLFNNVLFLMYKFITKAFVNNG